KQNAGGDAQPAIEHVLRIERKIQSEFHSEQIEMLFESGDRPAAYLRVEFLGNERSEEIFAQQRQGRALFLNQANLPVRGVQNHPLVFVEPRFQPFAPQRPDALAGRAVVNIVNAREVQNRPRLNRERLCLHGLVGEYAYVLLELEGFQLGKENDLAV